jgi:hypothetical protein
MYGGRDAVQQVLTLATLAKLTRNQDRQRCGKPGMLAEGCSLGVNWLVFAGLPLRSLEASRATL